MCRATDLYECAKLTLMFISREMAPPSTLWLFLPHSEQNVLKQTSFFTPERTGRLIFALAIKIEEEAPAVSSLELSGRVLRAVPPSCRLTWLWPSPPRFWYWLYTALLWAGLCSRPANPGLVLQILPGRISRCSLPGLFGPVGLTSASPRKAAPLRAQSLGESTIFRFRMLSACLYLHLNVYVPTRKACVRPDRPALY